MKKKHKLQLQQVLPYLPHKLKGIRVDGGKGIYILKTICENGELTWKSDFFGDPTQLEMKPILRPMSDLRREIEHNSKKIIPLVELAKISCPENKFKLNGILAINEEGYHFFYEKDFVYVHGVRCYPVNNQLQLFKKLFEWHFDVFELIEKGKAIDINTLNF